MKYPFFSIRLPKDTNARATRAALTQVAAEHGYSSDYHPNKESGSIGELVLAIVAGEVVLCPFGDEDYGAALAALRPFAAARHMWAESLVAAIEAARSRAAAAEAEELEEYITDDLGD